MKKAAIIFLVIVLMMVFVSCKDDAKVISVSLEVPEEVTIEGETMSMDKYVAGVLAAELQSWFNIETCRALAVAARTNTVRRLAAGKELINSTAFQCYYSENDLKEIYKDSWEPYYEKCYLAATSTHNQILVDSLKKPIDAMYHAMSSGKTEDSKYVTGYETTYLKSVESPWDKKVSGYMKERYITYEELKDYGFNRPEFKVVSYTSTNRPYTYEVCGKEYTATELMTKLKLKSQVFDVRYEENGIFFVTYGFGHNVGMSVYGAQGMAKEGYTYIQILHYFYTDINVAEY